MKWIRFALMDCSWINDDVYTDVLEELSAYCFETTGYKVEFSFKPMDKHYECIPEEYDFSDYDYDKYKSTSPP